MAAVLLLTAHPYPSRSRAQRVLLEAAREVPGAVVRPLYDLYPDFDIDVASEQQACEAAGLVVWMAPVYWYGVPAMLKHWFDRVLVKGWSHGEGGTALAGKGCLWVPTTGGGDEDYAPAGRHGRPFEAYTAPIEQTARYCGMRWLEPHVVLRAHELEEDAVRESARQLQARLLDWKAP